MTERAGTDEATCPECGALWIDGLSCWEQLGAVLAWEQQDPALAAEHFLTVAAYNFQHPAQFNDEALAGLRAVFHDYLDRGMSGDKLRRRVGYQFAGDKRVLKPTAERRPVRRQWPVTIAAVYAAAEPRGAAERVRAWASSIRQQQAEE